MPTFFVLIYNNFTNFLFWAIYLYLILTRYIYLHKKCLETCSSEKDQFNIYFQILGSTQKVNNPYLLTFNYLDLTDKKKLENPKGYDFK